MEIGFLIFALLIGAGYVAIVVRGLERNKPWAHEIARTVALMEPSRSYMDYHHIAEAEAPRRASVSDLTDGQDTLPDKLAA